MPRPGIAVSFAITVRFFFPWRTSSSITRSGVPTAMKPPIISVAPSGIMVTASSTEIVLMCGFYAMRFSRAELILNIGSGSTLMKIKRKETLLLRSPGTVDRQSNATDLSGSVRTQEYRDRSDLLRPGKLMGWLFFGQEFALAWSTEIFSRGARSLICFSTNGVSTQQGQMALQVMFV